MTAGVRAVDLVEWQRLEPAGASPLAGVYLPAAPGVGQLAEALMAQGILEISELRHGLHIAATSWVGRVALGDLQITSGPRSQVCASGGCSATHTAYGT